MKTLQKDIRPTPEQLKILTDSVAGFRLIRGAAGSGKTTAALLRLRQLCTSRLSRQSRLGYEDPVRVLVLTFNRTLRGYVMHLAEEQTSFQDGLHLTIETFAKWAINLIGSRNVIDPQKSLSWICSLLSNAGVANKDMNYFVDEIEYINGRFPVDEREAYIHASRSGRGRAPAVPKEMRARLLNEVIEPYEKKKFEHGYIDWNDVALKAATVLSQGYDIVVVDECQDLSGNQIRAILPHLNKDHVTTFIMDAVQRIYPQSFVWRELGINIRPNMVFSLSSNHRNTMEIAQFASSLVSGLPQEEDGTLPNAEACKRTGPRPQMVVGTYRAQLDYMLDRIQPFLDAGETVAILQPKGGGWFSHARQVLKERNVPYCELTRECEWPTGPELVALSTIHSAKGLEFDHVLLPGLSQEVTPHGDEDGDGTLDSLRRLLAMGIGRARQTVVMGYKPGEQSTLINLINPETYDLVEL